MTNILWQDRVNDEVWEQPKEEKMNEQELNQKLAEWAGFQRYKGEGELRFLTPKILPDLFRPDELDFTKSLDLCFKWLVPALPNGIRLRMLGQMRDKRGFFCSIGGKFLSHCYSEAETPALALCRAIEKLIQQA